MTLTLVLKLASILEIVTGLLLMICPVCVAQLLLNSGLTEASLALGRITGIGLFSLGIACWPNGTDPAIWPILTYNALITAYLIYIGVEGQWVGILLWPAAILHAILTLFLSIYTFTRRSQNAHNS